MRQKFLSLSLVIVLAFGCVAQQRRRADDSSPSVERLRAHVTYLASDKLEGRRTGSAGATAAAGYIAREFARAGLRRSVGRDVPGMSVLEAGSPRRYLQEFPFVAGVELGQKNALAAKPDWGGEAVALRAGVDWMPLGFSSGGKVEAAPAVFVHYGIAASELNRDDYAGADVKGKVVIALDGTPDGDNPHGGLGRYGDPRWKAAAAKDRGAKALVLLSLKERFSDDKLSALSYDNSGEAGLPVVALAKPAWERLLESVPEDKKSTGLVADARAHAAQSAAPKKFEKFSWSLTADVVRRSAPAYNVVGVLEGTDPQLKGEAIVIGAHYDHLGRGGAGSLSPRAGEIHHGADDNASGVAGLLELARLFAAERANMKRTLVFIAFGGEEDGLLGSNFYVNHPVWPLDKTVAMINMDMIGRMREKRLMIGGVGTAAEWKGWIDANNLTAGFVPPADRKSSTVILLGFLLTLNEDGYGPSDHSSFYAKQIPVLFFFTGTHEDYHKPSDTAEKIAYEDEAQVLNFIANIVRSVDAGTKRPTYAVARSPSPGRAVGFRVYLGTIPNYAESSDGMTLDGVREDSPAAAAGLKAGDKIVKMAGREVRNVYDYTYALGEMKAGEEYEVEVVRGGRTLKLKITPAARK
jgi:hypothetical protein